MMNFEKPSTTNPEYVYSEDDFDGYNAAPLLIVGRGANRQLVEAQDTLAQKFILLTESELSGYVKPSVVDFVGRSVVSRMNQREAMNSTSYVGRTNHFPDYSGLPRTSELYTNAPRNARSGSGTPLENEIARHLYGMKSVEYANLTIVGDARKDLEPAMWDAVSHLVAEDVTPRADQMYSLQVLGFDRDIRTSTHIGAMRIGMKRYLGKTEYGATVKGRTTAIVNLSPSSGVDSELVDLFRQTALDDKRIADLPEFKAAVSWLVEAQLPPGLVLARNETVYGMVPSANNKTV